MSTHTSASVGHMSPFTVLTREQRVKAATDPKTHPDTPPGPSRWPAAAACREVEHDLFHPINDNVPGPCAAQIRRARAVCRRCPAFAWCEAWALSAAGPESGILAAMTGTERKALKRREARQRQAANT